jgi:hypothetical protein
MNNHTEYEKRIAALKTPLTPEEKAESRRVFADIHERRFQQAMVSAEIDRQERERAEYEPDVGRRIFSPRHRPRPDPDPDRIDADYYRDTRFSGIE